MNFLFVGEYDYKLDGKGRVVIPSKLREAFEYEEEKGLYITTASDDSIAAEKLDREITWLELYTSSAWKEKAREWLEKAKQRRDMEWFLRRKVKEADFCAPDSQFRINLPNDLIEAAGLTREVTILGNFDHMELWDRATWEMVEKKLDRQKSSLEGQPYEPREE